MSPVLLLAFVLLTVATGALVTVLARGELRARRTPPPPPQRPKPSTIRVCADRLAKGAMVLTPSTPYRFRIERVLWIEHQPYGGGVMANLEGTDADTGMPTQRWHHWKPLDMVTAFVRDVQIDQHEGNYDGMYERYATGAEAERPARSGSSVIEQTLERLYGSARPS